MAKMYYGDDCNLNLLSDKKVAIIGNGMVIINLLSTGKMMDMR